MHCIPFWERSTKNTMTWNETKIKWIFNFYFTCATGDATVSEPLSIQIWCISGSNTQRWATIYVIISSLSLFFSLLLDTITQTTTEFHIHYLFIWSDLADPHVRWFKYLFFPLFRHRPQTERWTIEHLKNSPKHMIRSIDRFIVWTWQVEWCRMARARYSFCGVYSSC